MFEGGNAMFRVGNAMFEGGKAGGEVSSELKSRLGTGQKQQGVADVSQMLHLSVPVMLLDTSMNEVAHIPLELAQPNPATLPTNLHTSTPVVGQVHEVADVLLGRDHLQPHVGLRHPLPLTGIRHVCR